MTKNDRKQEGMRMGEGAGKSKMFVKSKGETKVSAGRDYRLSSQLTQFIQKAPHQILLCRI